MRILFFIMAMALFLDACGDGSNEVIYNASNTSVLNGVVCDANDKPISGLYREYHINGNIKMEIESKDGLPQGKGKFYDEDGILLYIADFENGQLNGKVLQYFPDGKVHNEISFSNGIQNGIQTTYNEKGKVIVEIEYKDGTAVKGCIYNNDEKIELQQSELEQINK